MVPGGGGFAEGQKPVTQLAQLLLVRPVVRNRTNGATYALNHCTALRCLQYRCEFLAPRERQTEHRPQAAQDAA